MSQHIKTIVVSLILIFPSVFEITTILGCSCVTWDFEYASEIANEIFLAKIISVEGAIENKPHITKFRVLQKWKGNKENVITIHSGITGCDEFFTLDNSTYLIYANKEDLTKRLKDFDNRLIVTSCSRSIGSNYQIENNWFEDDQIKLNDKYKLVKIYRDKSKETKVLIGFVFLMLILGFWVKYKFSLLKI